MHRSQLSLVQVLVVRVIFIIVIVGEYSECTEEGKQQQPSQSFHGNPAEGESSGLKRTGQIYVLVQPSPKGKGYVINVASYKNGVGYSKWTHIDGWSESVVEYIRALELT